MIVAANRWLTPRRNRRPLIAHRGESTWPARRSQPEPSPPAPQPDAGTAAIRELSQQISEDSQSSRVSQQAGVLAARTID